MKIKKAKNSIVFACTECGNESPRWEGQCRSCGNWNTYKEFKADSMVDMIDIPGVMVGNSTVKRLSDISIKSEIRLQTGISEFDSTIGGGIVPGQVILLGGNPGVGKSTLIMQIADLFPGEVLYVSGEESETQVALRAERLGVKKDNFSILSTNNLQEVLKNVGEGLLIVDSIQTMMLPGIDSSAGSITQIKECAYRLIVLAKQKGIPVIIIEHITKEGSLAGPKLLEHMVDTVLYMEGDKSSMFRMLRVQKNRFGDDTDVGLFEMRQDGMHGVKDPYLFLSKDLNMNSSGNVISVVMEGKRPIAIEVQALTVKTNFGYPKRTSSGYSLSRLQLLCAVLEKKAKINLSEHDVYLNIASGLNIREPAVDLAVCMAIISSYKDVPVKEQMVFYGEVGLSGEVRSVVAEERRLKEARNLGLKDVVYSKNIRNISNLSAFLVV